MFSVKFAYFSRIQRCPNKNKTVDNSSYKVKLLSRNIFDSLGDCDLEPMNFQFYFKKSKDAKSSSGKVNVI